MATIFNAVAENITISLWKIVFLHTRPSYLSEPFKTRLKGLFCIFDCQVIHECLSIGNRGRWSHTFEKTPPDAVEYNGVVYKESEGSEPG